MRCQLRASIRISTGLMWDVPPARIAEIAANISAALRFMGLDYDVIDQARDSLLDPLL
jgi:hypothetical protein